MERFSQNEYLIISYVQLAYYEKYAEMIMSVCSMIVSESEDSRFVMELCFTYDKSVNLQEIIMHRNALEEASSAVYASFSDHSCSAFLMTRLSLTHKS